MEDASGAHASTSRLDSVESMPVTDLGGVIRDEYDLFLSNIWKDENQKHGVQIFPGDGGDAMTIFTNNDMESLQSGGFLSESVIDFYIRFLQKELRSADKNRLHFFDSRFFSVIKEGDACAEAEQCKASFERVQKWTWEVNIFEKEYVFIPVFRSSHWSLIILCHLSGLASSADKHEGPPCILHLDPVEGKHGNLEGYIRRYIIHEWRERYHDPKVDQLLALSQMQYKEAKVPQQENQYDSGIYLLHFVELFLFELLDVGIVPNEDSPFTTSWAASEVSAKRRDISILIQELALASRRKFRECQRRCSRINHRTQTPEELETRLDVNGQRKDMHIISSKQFTSGVDERGHAEHQKSGEVTITNQQQTGTEQTGQQTSGETAFNDQRQKLEQLTSATSKPVKERSKRCKNWSLAETLILLSCKKEGGRFCKGRQTTTNWNAISQEIGNKLGTVPPTGVQCRLRYDTLLKAYKTANIHCMENGKRFSELYHGELKLATNLTEDWYNAIDEMCRGLPHNARSPKRVKYTLSVDDGGPTPTSPRDSPPRTPPMSEDYSEVTTAHDASVHASLSISRYYMHKMYEEHLVSHALIANSPTLSLHI
ncbi:hypothetical protein KC19_4G117400 [Ceratodon purpureus]|uniref:Ubiquitin-like protease family profile domain-containing protein n=1 Tax=Ceratodon purpureus TaxID=3225 RepID=A0A8T0I9K0_CERPU|nr:hypothetical protein KC19_4G117400 [Ceratodon purpureus]